MKKNKIYASTFVLRLYLLLFAVTIIGPLLWIVYTSFKSNHEFFLSAWALPEILHFENYLRAWNAANIGTCFMNSLMITAVVVIAVLFIGSLCTYACTRLGFRIGRHITLLFMFGLFIPTVLCLVPIYLQMRQLHLVDKTLGLIILYIASNLPFTVFVLSGFYKSIPRELEEAAYMDGCGYFRTYLNIILPVTKPALATVSIFTFMGSWNEYILANLLISSKEKATLTLGIVTLQQNSQHQSDWTALLAAMVIIMIPLMIMYAMFQKHITSGMTAGAVKG